MRLSWRFFPGFIALAIGCCISWQLASGQASPDSRTTTSESPAALEQEFAGQVQPLLKKYCLRCHNRGQHEVGHSRRSSDRRGGGPASRPVEGILKQVREEAMPPEDEPQPTAAERKALTDWIERALVMARSRPTPKNGGARRLTVAQYRNTLRDLLGLQEDLTDVLPPDGVSKDGFANNEQTLALSPLQVEAYFDIAEQGARLLHRR